ncbi:MAG: hypothetical protein H0W40_12890 [Methylibium sp.]|uniref:hypothetical protein n=1 Tax=Methylibium sp. TaxID=2067992 RepID=UPI00182A2F24|nr:hypothetical protein [Methylibium sp.]MBA3598252.1 hypothetical protein [Methylibium sp.]
MQMNQVQDSMNRIEQCADDAMAALRKTGGSTPDELRQCVDEMHSQSRQARQMAQQSSDEGQMVGCVDGLEQIGDRAMEACRKAGSQVDPQVQQAVKRAHDEISGLKKQMH